MSTSAAAATVEQKASGRKPRATLGVLCLLFAAMGVATLVYATVWFRLLQVIVGSTAASMMVMVALFFGGMGLGSWLFARFVARRFHPLRVLAILELATGLVAVIVTLLIPVLDRIYTSMARPGEAGVGEMVLRAIVCGICLLPPAILMGAIFPAAARIGAMRGPSAGGNEGGPWLVGILLGANLCGAAIGCFVAGFFLLPRFDMEVAIYLSVAVNGLMGAFANLVAGWTAEFTVPAEVEVKSATVTARSGADMVTTASIYVAIGLCGAAAMGAYVVWGRILSILLGDTIYAHSIIVAVFLLGLAAGSGVGAMLARTWQESAGGAANGVKRQGRFALGWSQILACLGIAWSAYALLAGLPYWPVLPSIAQVPRNQYEIDMARCLWAILPATLCWGAAVPFAFSAARADAVSGSGEVEDARIVGRVMAVALLGVAAGYGSFVLCMPNYRTAQCQQMIAGIAAAAGVVALIPAFFAQRVMGPEGEKWVGPSQAALFSTLVFAIGIPIAAGAVLSQSALEKIPDKLVAWGREIIEPGGDRRLDSSFDIKALDEGSQSTVAVTTNSGGFRKIFENGNPLGSTAASEIRADLILGHLPALAHAAPKTVLVLGCGTGVAAGAFILYPEIKRIVIVEQNPFVVLAAEKYFNHVNNGVVERDPHGLVSKKVVIVIDDPRHFLRTSGEKFDVIVNNPGLPEVDSWGAMYSREYFARAKEHLNAGGLLTHNASVVGLNEAAAKCELATFFAVFPTGTLWNAGGSDIVGDSTYNYVLMSGGELDADALVAKLEGRLLIKGQMGLRGVGTGLDLLRTYGGCGTELAAWAGTGGTQINDERNLQLTYLAAGNLFSVDEERIAMAVLERRKYPSAFMKASPELEHALRGVWGMGEK